MNKHSIHIVESVAGRISCSTSLDFHFQDFIKVEDFGSLSSSIFSYLIPFSYFTIYFLFIYVFGCTQSLLQHAGSFSCTMQTLNCGSWDLVPTPGVELRPLALEAQCLSHWTTTEVPILIFLS